MRLDIPAKGLGSTVGFKSVGYVPIDYYRRGIVFDIEIGRTVEDPIHVVLNAMREQVAKLNAKVDEILNQRQVIETNHPDSEYSLLALLPLKTMEEFDSFEFKTENDENHRSLLIKILISCGGKDLRTAVTNMLRRIILDSLAERFSYSGKMMNDTAKIAFNSKKICYAIVVAARKLFKHATEDHIRGIMCSWFQQAKTRENRRQKYNKL
ncbi:hypothetical protein FQR65_LT11690 [Abscondita terminalis]|nr:hypothetical protein FQR65_LT11690 [Abscondita terminalis]